MDRRSARLPNRATRCILGWRVGKHRSSAVIQTLVDEAVQGQYYYSDGYEAYQAVLYWPAQHQALRDKSQTYAVEANNAELRHYLARLARRSRCFSRCALALARAVRLFVFAWNHRQLFIRCHPAYPAHVMDFIYPPK